ncbi:hypothetical protein FA13DRAFT_1784619 [Coprinellus micaceus]|uniref:Uncharacterized protein n=1 Tax=Coprinellus micaceus TaxID=71717 RepID=A0A4Y7U130_COPMI|nr:hypothetical protein FA13DRAFT_1784619 [Coprinellus micaceus]
MLPTYHPSDPWMATALTALFHSIAVLLLLVSFGVEGAGALAVPLSWGTNGGLLKRTAAGEYTAAPGMSRQVAHGLSYALIIFAVLVGLAFLARRSQQWHRQRHGASPTSLPPFLRDRPSWGSIPVIMSPRTAAMVAQHPATYGSPQATHTVPHWAAKHFPPVAPLSPPPPAYTPAATVPGTGFQRVHN